MSEALAFPERLFGGEVRLDSGAVRSGCRADRGGNPRRAVSGRAAMAANARLYVIFNNQSPDWGRARARQGADRLHIAEQSVLAPIAELTAGEP